MHSFAGSSLAAIDSLKSDDSQMQNDYNNQFNIFKYTGATNISLAPSITSGFAPSISSICLTTRKKSAPTRSNLLTNMIS